MIGDDLRRGEQAAICGVPAFLKSPNARTPRRGQRSAGSHELSAVNDRQSALIPSASLRAGCVHPRLQNSGSSWCLGAVVMRSPPAGRYEILQNIARNMIINNLLFRQNVV